MKKIISFFLVTMMMLTLCMGTFAAEVTNDQSSGTITDTRGSITINNLTLKDGAPTGTLEIYQILKLESYDFNSGAYRYLLPQAGDPWYGFFITGVGAQYITIDSNNLVVWNGENTPARVEEFAQLALAYAEEHNIQPLKTTATAEDEAKQYTVTGESTIKFNDLELGYYLVDSSVGALCGLSTTNPNGIINSKNGAPTIDKQVQEDLTGQYGDVNSADIGQNVNFRTTIHVHDGAQNYVLHDIMEDGLTFDPATHGRDLYVKLVRGDGSTTSEGELIPREHEHDGVKHTVYEVVTTCTDGCTFEVQFSDQFCAQLNTNDRLIVFYSAMLNRNAEIGNGTADNPANQNRTYLEYGDHHVTTEDSVETKTYAIDLVKTDGQNKLLDGSTFLIYSAETGGEIVAVVPLLDEQGVQKVTPDGYNMYRRARADEAGDEVIVLNGKVRIIGFDNGTYWLQEEEAPEGYSKITARQRFIISDNNLDAIVTDGIVSTNSGVQVVNYTGTMLPETGAAGTTMFITCGMIVVLAAGVLLVTKKRMSMIK